MTPIYEANKGSYKVLKEKLIEDIEAAVAPLRARRTEFEQDPTRVEKIIEQGNARAKEVAAAKMKLVREKVGVSL